MTLFKLPRFVTRSHDVIQVTIGVGVSIFVGFSCYWGG